MYKIIVKDNCPICEQNVERLKSAGLSDKVEIIHISSPEGLDLAKSYKLKMAGSDIIDTETKTKMTVDEFLFSQR